MPGGTGRATTKKIPTWKKLLEIDEDRKGKSQMTNTQRQELICGYLLECACEENCTHHSDAKRLKSCHCLGFLKGDDDDDEQRKMMRAAVAKYVLWWVRQSRTTQQALLMAQIRYEGELKKCKTLDATKASQNNFPLPFQSSGAPDTAIELADVMICQSALMKILRIGRNYWGTCTKALHEGTAPTEFVHGLTGVQNVRAKIFDERFGQKLKDFFENDLRQLANSPGPDDIEELDPEWSKRRCYGRFLWGQGFSFSSDAKANMTVEERTDADYRLMKENGFEADRKTSVCSWTSFRLYWAKSYPKLVVHNKHSR
jgi:hypothetical protein